MKALKWVSFESECEKCGTSPILVLTKSNKENWVYDDEEAKCPDCGYGGIVHCDDNLATVYWDDVEDDLFNPATTGE